MSTITDTAPDNPGSTRPCPSRPHRDLRSRQAWTLDHITRCSCGAWVVVTDRLLRDITSGAYEWPVVCRHYVSSDR